MLADLSSSETNLDNKDALLHVEFNSAEECPSQDVVILKNLSDIQHDMKLPDSPLIRFHQLRYPKIKRVAYVEHPAFTSCSSIRELCTMEKWRAMGEINSSVEMYVKNNVNQGDFDRYAITY